MQNVLNEREAAAYLGVSSSFLRQSRQREGTRKSIKAEGPPWIKFGAAVRYRSTDLDAWLERHLVNPSNEQVAMHG
jgi:predicted DNA-binding transcriptional regulator AlpA